MLTPGNHKLGRSRIGGRVVVRNPGHLPRPVRRLPGRLPYAMAVEQHRSAAAALYRRNWRHSRCRDFARRVRAFLVLYRVRVVRVHTGGRLLLGPVRPPVATGDALQPAGTVLHPSWRVPEIRVVIDRMAAPPNCVAWYSVDRDTGGPVRVRVAWLRTAPADLPPPGTDLVFRVRRLRRVPEPGTGPRACPAEDGGARTPH